MGGWEEGEERRDSVSGSVCIQVSTRQDIELGRECTVTRGV